MSDPKIVFAGTPEFAVASLQALIKNSVRPCAVLTQPDRPAGRGKRVTPSPVKQLALEHDIALLQPETLRDDAVVAELAALNADIMVVAAYGQILPQSVLELPRSGCVNVHASLLPRWRGAAPIQAAILANDRETGVCLMSMQAGLDSGPVYVSQAMQIGALETAGELHDRLADAGGKLLTLHLDDIIAGKITPTEQNERQATLAPKIKTADSHIDWRRPAADIERLIRAYNPVPGAWFMLGETRIKCWAAQQSAAVDAPPGTVVAAGQDGIVVSCGEGALKMDSLQRPGKRAVQAAEFSSQTDLVGQAL
jgi:methionyl-tRNA formyltransferase